MDATVPWLQTVCMDDTEKPETIAKVTDLLVARYPDTPRAVIARVVTEEYDSLDETKIRTYIPTLVEHAAKDRLHHEFGAGPTA